METSLINPISVLLLFSGFDQFRALQGDGFRFQIKLAEHGNIDNPFLNQETLDILFKEVDNFDYISPSFNGKGGHPFLVSAKVINELKTEKQDQIHLKEFLGKYSKKLEEVNDEKILLNINTMEDYSRFFNL